VAAEVRGSGIIPSALADATALCEAARELAQEPAHDAGFDVEWLALLHGIQNAMAGCLFLIAPRFR
jgi:hypothetical protein